MTDFLAYLSLRGLFTLFVGCCLWTSSLVAQTPFADRLSEVDGFWLAGDLEAINQGWEADSSLFLAPAAPRPKKEADQRPFAKLLRRLADTQQLLCRPDREAFVWQILLIAANQNGGAPDSLEMEVRGQLLKFTRLDEEPYNLPDTAALHFGLNSYHYRKAVRLEAMKAYNQGDHEAVDSLLALVSATASPQKQTDSLELAFLQRIHGVQAMAATNYGAARRWFSTALAICPRQPSGYSPHSLLRLDMAHAYRAMARYDSAHWQLDTVVEELHALKPELLQLKGILHQRRGMVHRSANQLRLATKALEQADEHLSAYSNSLSYQGDLMLTRSTLASVRRQRQDWRGAGEAYLRCIELAQARREPNSLQLLGLNLNYAGVLGLCGDFTDGFKTAQKALELSRERFGGTHLYVAVALNTMAENLIGLGRYEEAEEYARQSLKIREKLYPRGHERLIYPNIVLAQLLEKRNNTLSAVAYRRHVLQICRGQYGRGAANCREHRIDLIHTLHAAGKEKSAKEELLHLNTDFPPNLPLVESDNPAFDIAQLELNGHLAARLPSEVGAAAGAGGSPFGAAIDRFDEVQFGFDTEEASILLAGAYGDVFRQQALIDYRIAGPPVHGYRAWESVARLKYNALWRFRNERAIRNRFLPKGIQARFLVKEQALAAAQQLRKTGQRRPGQINPDSLVRLVERVQLLEADYEQLKDSIQQRFPAYAKSRFEKPVVNWEQLKGGLAANERLVEFFWADSLMIVFSLAGGELQTTDFEIAEEDQKAIDTFYTQLASGSPTMEQPAFLDRIATWLTHQPEETLIVLTDGPLSRIPLAGLQGPGGKYLAEDKNIRYAWSLFDEQEREGVSTTAYPVFGVFPGDAAELPSRDKERERLFEVASLLPDSGRYWMEDRSSPPGIWHFATHAYADFSHPENAYLLLPGEGERLFVSDLRIQEDVLPLVVLSACETGTGRWQSGEGVNSMARAFARAGARTTLTTLWKIPDAAAAKITTSFYRHLADGLPQAAALREAQRDYLATVDDPRQRAPLFWAGFVLTGEGGTLNLARDGNSHWWWLGGLACILALAWGVVSVIAGRNRK